MQNQQQKFIQLQNSFLIFKSLFHPKYQPKCTADQFLQKYNPLFQELHKIDNLSKDQFLKIKMPINNFKKQYQSINENQTILQIIAQELNKICTFCHRKQIIIRIKQELSNFNGNLKDLTIDKQKNKISEWQQMFYSKTNIQNFENTIQIFIIQIFDRLYLEYQRIPNYYLLILDQPQTLINLNKFQCKLILNEKSDKTSISISHKYYLGIIAASTFGSRYLWNFTVRQFIKSGGDINWIKYGIQQTPKYIQKFSEISYQMAFNFKINTIQNICYDLGTLVQDTAILQGLYILSYYQFLAAISLVFGLIPESTEYQIYLTNIQEINPSINSFQSMKQISQKQQIYEKQLAKQLQQMYLWEVQKKLQTFKKINNSKKQITSLLTNKLSQLSLNKNKDLKQSTQLMIAIQQQQIVQKIKNSKTMKNIQNVYQKYVPFNNRLSSFQYKRQRKTQVSNSNNQLQSAQIDSNQSLNRFVYASEWNFDQHTENMMNFVMGQSFYSQTKNLLSSLRFMNKQKSKNMKVYYQSLHNYMYQYVPYVTLINQNLSVIEKNYIKIITRSPFLFSQESFLKMKQEILSECGCSMIQIVFFCMQIFSFKLQHSLCLSSYVYHNYFENIE